MNTMLRSQRLSSTLWLGAILMLVALVMPVSAAPQFPQLTGRVVDNAGILSTAQEQALTQRLANAEQQSSSQLVVVTLADLQGYAIEDYGYQLGREWGIGQQGKDNGVLLIVAPNERKVRIEVGYGLEGALTDAVSSSIIHNQILPAFRQGDFAAGIEAGVASILAAIKGEYQASAGSGERQPDSSLEALLYLLGLVIFTFFLSFGGMGRKRGRGVGLMFLPMGMGGSSGGGFGGGGFGGGGFGGGGGGFGGGGASGGW